MADPTAVVFEVILGGIAFVLLVSYISFVRMNAHLRRARLFVMAARINRFLLAFTLGFLSITIVILVAFTGVTLPTSVTGAAVFLWIGAILYGSLEILFVARPNLLHSRHPAIPNHRRGTE